MNRTPVEDARDFDARIAREDAEAMAVQCPLDSCLARIGDPCRTEGGQPRLRHCRRLWLARKAVPRVTLSSAP